MRPYEALLGKYPRGPPLGPRTSGFRGASATLPRKLTARSTAQPRPAGAECFKDPAPAAPPRPAVAECFKVSRPRGPSEARLCRVCQGFPVRGPAEGRCLSVFQGFPLPRPRRGLLLQNGFRIPAPAVAKAAALSASRPCFVHDCSCEWSSGALCPLYFAHKTDWKWPPAFVACHLTQALLSGRE